MGDSAVLCYKIRMPKIIGKWILFEYIGLKLTPLSKPFKSKEQAEQERLKYSEKDRKRIGLGVVRMSE
jgi:hypothetical protein